MLVDTMKISAEALPRLNKSLDSVQYPPELGGSYMATIEVFHQLHVSPPFFWFYIVIKKKQQNKKQQQKHMYIPRYEAHTDDRWMCVMQCVNLLRQFTYREYYDQPGVRPMSFTDSEPTLRKHIGTCWLM